MGSSMPPQPSVVYDEPVIVGYVLPELRTYYAVPNKDEYSYDILNNRKVIVDRQHWVVRVIE